MGAARGTAGTSSQTAVVLADVALVAGYATQLPDHPNRPYLLSVR